MKWLQHSGMMMQVVVHCLSNLGSCSTTQRKLPTTITMLNNVHVQEHHRFCICSGIRGVITLLCMTAGFVNSCGEANAWNYIH
eukprot:323020-Amphidinium_carterae.1